MIKKLFFRCFTLFTFLIGANTLCGSASAFENINRSKISTEVSKYPAIHNEMVKQRQITGIVTTENELPIPGVTVYIKGTTIGTITDFDGKYVVDIPDQNSVLIFSLIGMKTQEVKVGSSLVIDVVLEKETSTRNDEVNVAYGKVKKQELTGAVSSIDLEKLENIPNARIDRILQGQAAGVHITTANGSPGMETVMRIRGGNSIEGNNQPLWVIDGIIVGLNYNLNNINSNDIEAIEILKDASSVALYGNRGANGVVLVTTKMSNSAPGKSIVNANLSTGIQSIIEHPEIMTGPQHVAYVNEASIYAGKAESTPDLSKVANTDWIDLLTQNAGIYNADLSIAGTSENGNTNFYISANYFKQNGVIKNSGIEKYIFRTNFKHKVSKKAMVGFRMNFAHIERDNGTVQYGSAKSSEKSILNTLRERGVYDEDGNYDGTDPFLGIPAENIAASAEQNINETISNNILATLFLEYDISNKLKLRTTFNPQISNAKTNIFNSSQAPHTLLLETGGSASVSQTNDLGWNNENTIRYITNFGANHKFVAVGGFTLENFAGQSMLSEAYGIYSDATTFNNLSLGSDPSRNIVGSDYTSYRLISYLGRINYTFKDKYLLTLVGRGDGSSRFSEGNKYAFFPSVAAAWRLSEEPFIKDLNLFDELKIRASYGKSGGQAIASFRTMALMVNAKTTYDGTTQDGSLIGRPANENLKWETTHQLDIGLEASFWKQRINLEIDYYKKNTTDLLLEVKIPRQSGYESRLENLGEVQNQGLELLLKTTNIDNPNFSWTSALTISGNRSKVIDLGGVDYIDGIEGNDQAGPAQKLILGQAAPVFVGLNYLGTWKSEQEIKESGQINQKIGGAHFEDRDGDNAITIDDFVVLGKPEPDFIYGLYNRFAYKNFDLSLFIQGTRGNDIYNTLTRSYFFGRYQESKYAEVVNRWSPNNPTSNIPRAGEIESLSQIKSNSEILEDGSFLRIKSLQIGYTVPLSKWGNSKIDQLKVYATARNLFLFSNFRNIDPETSKYGNSENIAQGFSEGEYPNPRIISFGINLTF